MNIRIRGSVIKASDSSNEENSFVGRCDFFLRKLERDIHMWLEDEAQKWLSVCVKAERHISKASLESYLNSCNIAFKALFSLTIPQDICSVFFSIYERSELSVCRRSPDDLCSRSTAYLSEYNGCVFAVPAEQ
jgi:hypothetical protein